MITVGLEFSVGGRTVLGRDLPTARQNGNCHRRQNLAELISQKKPINYVSTTVPFRPTVHGV